MNIDGKEYVVLTYGTLMQGQCRSGILTSFGCAYVTDLTLSGVKMYHFRSGNYPVILPSDNAEDSAVCEAWSIPDDKEVFGQLLSTLNYIEGAPKLYECVKVDCGNDIIGLMYMGNVDYWTPVIDKLDTPTLDEAGKWTPKAF